MNNVPKFLSGNDCKVEAKDVCESSNFIGASCDVKDKGCFENNIYL